MNGYLANAMNSLANVATLFRMESGSLEVRLVQPQHLNFPELAKTDRLIASKFGDTWQAAPFGEVTRVCDEKEVKLLEAMPLEHDFAPGITWGVQVKLYNMAKQAKEWNWVRPSRGEPYKFDSAEIADSRMRMMYPDLIVGTEVRVKQQDSLS